MATFLATMPLWAKLLVGLVPAIAAGISGIASYNASKETNSTNVRLTNENNALQMQLAGQANDWSIEQWNRENQFNNPVAQRMRLENAGINPALIYGNGGLVNEAASSPAVTMANTKAAHVATPSIPDPLTAAQVANLNAQTESIQHNTDREDKFLPFRIKEVEKYSEQVDSQVKDLANQIEYRGKTFDLEKSVKEFGMKVDSEKLKQKWEELHISEENLRLQISLFPYMSNNLLAQAAEHYAAAAKATTEKEINDVNLKIAKLLDQVVEENKELIKTGQAGKVSADVAQNAATEQTSIRWRELAENPTLFWTYQIFSTLINAGAKITAAAIN